MVIRRLFVLPLLAGSLLAAAPAGAFAQSVSASPTPAADASAAPAMGTPHRHRNKMMSALRELNLSEDQKSKIKGFMTSFRDARTSGTPETRAELRGQIEGVLTPEQRARFEARMQPRLQSETAPS